MATKTKQQLATAVMRAMGALDSDEDASGTDYTYITGVYDTKLEQWRDDGLAYWKATETPDVVFDTVVSLLVNHVQKAYGMMVSEADKARGEQLLLAQLRRHVAKRSSGKTTMALYY
jgi:hypothetical protein